MSGRSTCAATSRKSPLVSMATSLSRPISDTAGCLICQRLALAAIFGQPRQNFQEIIRSLSVAACVAAPIVSLPRDASQKRDSTHFRSFAARLPVKLGSHVTIRQPHGLSHPQIRRERVTAAHHSSKAFEKQTYMPLENVLRGSGDIGALCATCWGVKQVDGSANGIRRLIPNLYRALALTI